MACVSVCGRWLSAAFVVAGAFGLIGCDREPCAPVEIDPFWSNEHADLLPEGIVVCGGTVKRVRYDFDPEPPTFPDVIVVQLLESKEWVRIKQSRRKTGRKYILEKGPNTLIVHADTEKGRTVVSYEWRP